MGMDYGVHRDDIDTLSYGTRKWIEIAPKHQDYGYLIGLEGYDTKR